MSANDEMDVELFEYDLKAPPNYLPVPPHWLVLQWKQLCEIPTSKEIWKGKSWAELRAICVWFMKSTQTQQIGFFDNLFTLHGEKTITNAHRLSTRSAEPIRDTLDTFYDVMLQMGNQYKEWNIQNNKQPWYEWGTLWQEVAPKKKTLLQNRTPEERSTALHQLTKDLPQIANVVDPGKKLRTEFLNFVIRGSKKIPVDNDVIQAGDMPQLDSQVLPVATKNEFMSWADRSLNAVLVARYKALDENYTLPLTGWQSWIGSLVIGFMEKISVAGKGDPNSKWPPYFAPGEQSFVILFNQHGTQLGLEFEALEAAAAKNPLAGRPTLIDLLNTPCPSPTHTEQLAALYQNFTSEVVNSKGQWLDFQIAEIEILKGMLVDGIIPDTEVADHSNYVSYYLEEWSNLPGTYFDKNVRASIEYCAFRAWRYAEVLHGRIAGRERSLWIWDKDGNYVNPTPEEKLYDCLRTAHLTDPPKDCRPERFWKEPWKLVGDELEEYIDTKAPFPTKYRVRATGESVSDYERLKQQLMGNYNLWRGTITANPAKLQEWPIGSDKQVEVELEDGKKKMVSASNMYCTFGIVEENALSPSEQFWWTTFNPYKAAYGESFIDFLIKLAGQLLAFVVQVFKVAGEAINDLAKNLLLPLTLVAAGVAVYFIVDAYEGSKK